MRAPSSSAGMKPPFDPDDSEAWEGFLEAKVRAGVEKFLAGVRRHLESPVFYKAASLADYRVAIAAGLVSGRNRDLGGEALRTHVQSCFGTHSYSLVEAGVVTAAEYMEAARLSKNLRAMETFARRRGAVELVRTLKGTHSALEEARKGALGELEKVEARVRLHTTENRWLFRTLAFYDRGQRPSKVALVLAVILGYEGLVVPLMVPSTPHVGRPRDSEKGIGAAFLRALPGSRTTPRDTVRFHVGKLGVRAEERAMEGARFGIGFKAFPRRYETLARLLAVLKHTDAVEALNCGDSYIRQKMMKALEKRCLRRMEEDAVPGGPAFSDEEWAAAQAGLLLARHNDPDHGVQWETSDSDGAEPSPPPPRT